MKIPSFAILLSLLCLAPVAQAAPAADAAPRLSLEAFFGANSLRRMVLSPDGTKIAVISPNQGRYSLGLLNLQTGEASVVVRMNDENISEVFWKGNDRLLFYADVGGLEVPMLASADLSGKHVKRILEPKIQKDSFHLFSGTVLDRLPDDPQHILILGYTDESDSRKARPLSSVNPSATIYRVDVRTGRRSRVTIPDEKLSELVLDRASQLRFAVETRGDVDVLRYRKDNSALWRDILSTPTMQRQWSLLKFAADNRHVYLIDYTENDFGSLRLLDTETMALGPVLFAAKDGEISDVILSRDAGTLLGIAYETDRDRVQWVDEDRATLARQIDGTFPHTVNSVLSISDDKSRYLIYTRSDRDPGAYYLLDRAKGKMQLLGRAKPDIDPENMAAMQPVVFTARDGLAIHGYLTLPKGPVGTKWPLIINPHGGPFGIRDSWGFNSEVQFLANRGYAVLQVNYRGSGGYGGRFLQAGYREWGGKMQDDLSDAVAWAINEGYADPARVAIYGASYGGYAALAGVTFTPELYCCAVNYVGVSDMRLQAKLDVNLPRAMQNFYKATYGASAAELAQHSPVNFVANIRVPTLHAYGENDPRVDIRQWEVLETQLKKHNKPYRIIIQANEGHGFGKAETSVPFYQALESFLAENMGASGKVKLGELKTVELPARETK